MSFPAAGPFPEETMRISFRNVGGEHGNAPMARYREPVRRVRDVPCPSPLASARGGGWSHGLAPAVVGKLAPALQQAPFALRATASASGGKPLPGHWPGADATPASLQSITCRCHRCPHRTSPVADARSAPGLHAEKCHACPAEHVPSGSFTRRGAHDARDAGSSRTSAFRALFLVAVRLMLAPPVRSLPLHRCADGDGPARIAKGITRPLAGAAT
jgi:hypothetical protein